MTNAAYENMSGSELVEYYNGLVKKFKSEDFKPVNRFSTTAAGIARCAKLEAAMEEAKKANDEKENEDESAANEIEEEQPTEIAELLAQFKPRKGTLREKLLILMIENRGTSMEEKELVTDIYGTNPKNPTAIRMVLKGVEAMIKKNQIKWELRKARNGENFSYGLYQING